MGIPDGAKLPMPERNHFIIMANLYMKWKIAARALGIGNKPIASLQLPLLPEVFLTQATASVRLIHDSVKQSSTTFTQGSVNFSQQHGAALLNP